MRTFELNIFIDRPCEEVYEHLAQPINMIGLQPRLTTIDILKEQNDAKGIILRPFHSIQIFRWLGLPVLKPQVYTVIHVTNPPAELEYHVFSKPGIQIVYHYLFQESEQGWTHLIQKFRFEKVSRLLEDLVFAQVLQAQRVMLTNLKVRLEKSYI
jgi:hypothetical protein